MGKQSPEAILGQSRAFKGGGKKKPWALQQLPWLNKGYAQGEATYSRSVVRTGCWYFE